MTLKRPPRDNYQVNCVVIPRLLTRKQAPSPGAKDRYILSFKLVFLLVRPDKDKVTVPKLFQNWPETIVKALQGAELAFNGTRIGSIERRTPRDLLGPPIWRDEDATNAWENLFGNVVRDE